MRQASSLLPARLEPTAAVTHGVARGLADSCELPGEELPTRMQELVQHLREREAPKPTKLVLIVEDDPDVRDLAMALLDETVLDVVTCESGEAAVQLLKERAEDIAMLFTDVQLAGSMDGIELAKAVNGLWPSIHLVVTSGHTAAQVADLPGEAVFMAKPWLALDVLREVDRAVRHPELPIR
ncbi:CheY-like chemotaxis protein [Methylobacterium sp. BE186]|uniref:response regulator n=1 Tax=Methylobacterium sp. BE186 TaxID=2817715 RepID=UPI002862D535|nr:response regulator [Methylobacterium sp. BE186]MDR7040467.1 CheY-like chemotaxis protein [Methylobacterium sp. BE186]